MTWPTERYADDVQTRCRALCKIGEYLRFWSALSILGQIVSFELEQDLIWFVVFRKQKSELTADEALADVSVKYDA